MNEEIELGMRFGMCGCGSIIKEFQVKVLRQACLVAYGLQGSCLKASTRSY